MQSTVTNTLVARPKLYIPDILIGIVMLLVLFRGFIENFIGHGTLLVDCFFILLLFWEIYACYIGKAKVNKHQTLLTLYIVWSLLCLLTGFVQVLCSKTTLYAAAIGFRNNNIYTGLFFIAIIWLDRNGVKRFYKLLVNCGVIICAFAIVQYFFRDQLPDSLLFLNDEGNFGLYGTDVIRVTGLMGNTIIFSGFTIIICSLIWGELITCKYRPIVLWWKLIIVIIANILTFSRAANVGMIAVFLLEFILYGCVRGKALKYIAVSGFVLLIGIALVLILFGDSVMVQRIFGSNTVWNIGSDTARFSMISDAIAIIKDNWLFGTLMGQSNSIVTDGVFWAYIMEMGIPVFIVYCMLLFFIFKIALKACKSADKLTCTISIGYIGMNAYLLAASIINSAYSARSVLVFVWLVGGMVVSMTRNTNNDKKITYRRCINDS